MNGEQGVQPPGCFPCFSALEWIALVYWNSSGFVLAVINSLFRAGGKVGYNFLHSFIIRPKEKLGIANR